MIKNASNIIKLFFIITLMMFSFLQPVLSQENNDCEQPSNKKATKYFNDAEHKFKFKAYSDATMFLRQAIELEENYYEAYYILGRINYDKMNIVAANKYFLKQIEICPSYKLKTYFYLGNIAYGADNFDDAVKYLGIYLKDIEKAETEKEFTQEEYNEAKKLLKYAKTYSELLSHPVPFNPQVVEGISTKEDEYLAILTPDNEIAYFTRNAALPPQKTVWGTEKKYKERFMYSLKQNGKFDIGEPMPSPFNLHDNEGGATVTIDNKTLYYTLCQYKKGGKYQNCDIYKSEYSYGTWGDILALDSNINIPDSWESQPSITSDGKTLYFVSDRAGGSGGYDIYVSHKDESGNWSKASNIGTQINTKGNEKAPFIHTDSRTLYFSTDGRTGMGGYDIFYSKMNDDSSWTEPKNIGYPINTRSDDVGFFASTDGHYGYFASNQLKGPGGWDIFSFELYKEARPDKVLLVKGTVKDEKKDEPVKAKIELQNIATKKINEIPVDSTTGEYVFAVPFRNDYLLTVKKEGYAFSSKYLAQEDSTLVEPSKVDIDIKPLEVGEAYRLNDIYFATDSFTLSSLSKVVIDHFIDFLKENPHMKIAIHGHTDNVGDDNYNLALSENRAKSVYQYMLEKGLSEQKLSYKGFGETKPVDSNFTMKGRAKNRRTEFVIIEK